MSRKHRNAEVATVDNGEVAPVESKADKFRRLAMARVPKLIGRIKQVSALANPSQYEWTTEQWDKIESTVLTEVNKMRQRFNGVKVTEEAFTL